MICADVAFTPAQFRVIWPPVAGIRENSHCSLKITNVSGISNARNAISNRCLLPIALLTFNEIWSALRQILTAYMKALII